MPNNRISTLRRAAQILEEDARTLKEWHAINGKWPTDEQVVKDECAELRRIARELRFMARNDHE